MITVDCRGYKGHLVSMERQYTLTGGIGYFRLEIEVPAGGILLFPDVADREIHFIQEESEDA